MDEQLAPLMNAVKAQDFTAFDTAFKSAIESANSWHDYYEKPYIVWKLPDAAPPDLDMTPRGEA
jgi:hypothetical protein